MRVVCFLDLIFLCVNLLAYSNYTFIIFEIIYGILVKSQFVISRKLYHIRNFNRNAPYTPVCYRKQPEPTTTRHISPLRHMELHSSLIPIFHSFPAKGGK